MLTLAGLGSLVFGFGILVATFVCLARLWERRWVRRETVPEGESAMIAAAVDLRRRGTRFGVQYGVILGGLACVLFWLSPLTLALSAVGLYYSGAGMVRGGPWHMGTLSRGVIGLILNGGSVVLHYLAAMGELPSRPF